MQAVKKMFEAAVKGGVEGAVCVINTNYDAIMNTWRMSPELMYGYADMYRAGTGATIKDAIAVARAGRTDDFSEALDILFKE